MFQIFICLLHDVRIPLVCRQVNPHVVPFLVDDVTTPISPLHRLERHIVSDVRARLLKYDAKGGYLPSELSSLCSQVYLGKPTDVNIFPQPRLADLTWRILKAPTRSDVAYFVAGGQRMAFPHLRRIALQTRLEHALTRCAHALDVHRSDVLQGQAPPALFIEADVRVGAFAHHLDIGHRTFPLPLSPEGSCVSEDGLTSRAPTWPVHKKKANGDDHAELPPLDTTDQRGHTSLAKLNQPSTLPSFDMPMSTTLASATAAQAIASKDCKCRGRLSGRPAPLNWVPDAMGDGEDAIGNGLLGRNPSKGERKILAGKLYSRKPHKANSAAG
eukprot:scaffold110193_cov30-Tisochrysis_lutea.AAC.1